MADPLPIPPVGAAGTDRPYPHATNAWKPLLVFAVFTAVITLAGATVFQRYKESLKTDSQNDLAGIADLKIRQIVNWMDERRGNAEILSNDPLFLDEVDRWLQQGGPAGAARAKLAERLTSLQQAYMIYGYTSISLFDEHAMLRLSSSAGEGQIAGMEKTRLLESMQSGQVVFSDIHREKFNSGERIEIELRAPLKLVKNGRVRSIGAILFRIDPYRFIFPLIQHWPTPSASAENLLVRRDGDEVVFLNELRNRRNAPFALRFPLSRQQLLATQAATGKTGLAEGLDYRDVPVVGVLSKIPDTSWFMVSKIDKAEIYAPINRLAEWMAVLLLILAGTGGILALYWRQGEIRQYQDEIERHALSRHLDYLAKYANDIILLLDSTGRLVDFNDRALDALGYSAEELLRLGIDDIRAAGFSSPPAERFRQVEQAGGALLFESMLVRKGGESFPVEASVRRLDISGERFYQAIVRDISERKKAEETLRFHSKILQNLSEGIVLVRAGDGVIVFTNSQFERMFGYEPGELVDRHVSVVNAPGEKSPEEVAQEINGELARKGVWSGEVHNIRKDGTTLWCHARVSVFEHPQFGKVWVSMQEDISERKLHDRQLAERSMRIRALSHQLVNLKEEEMRRLSGELHDRCSPNLSALKLYFRLLANSLPAQTAEETDQLLKDISTLLSDTTDAIREVCADLRPAVLDYAGLWPALESLAQHFSQRTGIAVEFEADAGKLRFAPDTEIRLFRLVQEALTNCAKHAQAKKVRISLSRHGEGVMLSICDDGIGFDPGELGKSGHQVGLGLITMREGVEFVGGKFSLDTRPGHGTCIRVELAV